MIDDIVSRLRMQNADYALQEEAADDIERLRAEVDLKGSRLDDALDEIERLRAENADLRNTHRAIHALAWRVSEQHPSHWNAWIDIRQMTSNPDVKEARRG